ncbi:MAG TPA: hypothetical protein PLR12_05510 [Clostridia bacterium]|mgnify:FL=1|nr:hypothetical protein [Clostridia bacterium]
MTPEQLQREFRYRVALALVQELKGEGLITEDDFTEVRARLIHRFHPVLEGLHPKN